MKFFFLNSFYNKTVFNYREERAWENFSALKLSFRVGRWIFHRKVHRTSSNCPSRLQSSSTFERLRGVEVVERELEKSFNEETSFGNEPLERFP